MSLSETIKAPLSPAAHVLVVDDHPRARESVVETLSAVGYRVSSRSSAIEALADFDALAPDVVVTDLQMPGMDGLEFVRRIQRRAPDCRAVMITAHASITTAVEAMRCGAFDYVEKPFDPEALERVVERALRHGDQVGPRSTMPASDGSNTMVGDSPAMRRLRRQIALAAPTDATVLITGESGVGKELVARSLHLQSARAQRALVAVNCAALSPSLMESELFGHERGAFTNADAPRVGRFELADQGTLLLDEVAEIDLALQSKLLRVLQERVFERVGSNQPRPVDARVIAATNRDLTAEIRRGAFRGDLFFRLNVMPIEVPPLRDRQEDLPQLASRFAHAASARMQREAIAFDDSALDVMQSYSWPGNVRELENLVMRMAIVVDGDLVRADDVRPALLAGGEEVGAPKIGTAPKPASAPAKLDDMERSLIETTLAKFGGHREKTAQALGIGVRTLANKLKQYGYAPRTKVFRSEAA